jgi:hypothetical protein
MMNSKKSHLHQKLGRTNLGLPKQVSGNRRLALRKLEERRADAEARL